MTSFNSTPGSIDRVTPKAPVMAARRSLVRVLAPRLVALGLALVVAGLLAETLVRVARPGFPGFRIPQVEHTPVDGLGFVMVPSQTAYTAASLATINPEGFRGPAIKAERVPGSLRVFCLGDSITFGVGVEDSDPYPRQLEAMLASEWLERKPEVINGGVQRYFTYQEIDQLKTHGPRFRPDVVTLGVYSNDIAERPAAIAAKEYDNERERAAASFRSRVPLLYRLLKNSAAVELAKQVYLSSAAESENFFTRTFRGVATDRDERRWHSFEQEIEEFARLARELRFLPVVVVIPARSQVVEEAPESLYPKRVLAMAERRGIPALDPLERFKRSLRAGADPYLPWDNHLSRQGHALVAEMLKEEIARLDIPR